MRPSPIVIVTCLPLLCVGVASAQQAANNGGGRALDANQQAGTGGYNVPSGQVDYRARNDLITGNVQGGRQFQDTVDYTAPGAFGDGAGSDDLFNFRVNSLPSSAARLNSTQIYSREQRDFYSVYQTYTDVPVYRTGGRYMNQNLVPGNEGLQYAGPATSRVTGIIAPGLVTSFINPARPTGSLDVFDQPDGSALQVQASPLLGVRRSVIRGNPLTNPSNPRGLESDDEPTNAINADAASQYRVSTDPNALSSGVGTASLYAQQGSQVAPGLVLGQQLSLAYDPQRSNETIDDRMRRLEQRIYSPLGNKNVQPGQDVYLDLLTAMRAGDVPQPQDDAQRGPFGTGVNALEGELEVPSQSQLDRAEQMRSAVLQQAIEATAVRGDAGQTSEDGSAQDGEAPGVGQLVNQLNYDLPRLETLAGQRETRVNESIRKAEADLAAGKYFSAEALYRQALSDQPNDPLIRVGLVHAQLGAGMIRSAAYNLRLLFQEHPELIAAQYDAKLLPAATRLKWVQGELQKMIDDPAGNADAGLMLAYLGYQVDSRQLIRYGLANAEAKAPKDSLFPLLRRIWLDESAGDVSK